MSEVAVLDGDSDWGPAMLALPNDRWRAAAFAYAHGPGGTGGSNKGYKAACVAAGWPDTDNLRITAHRLFNDKRMHAALMEIAQNDIACGVPVARRVMSEIMMTPGHKDQYNASKTLLALGGMREAVKVDHTIEHTISDETLTKLASMARTLGVDPQKMLGWRHAGQIIDVEHEVVANRSQSEIDLENMLKGLS